MKIGLVGGTGREGSGLARRWQKAGHEVAIGSRDAARAVQKAAELGVSGGSNREVAANADVVVITVPYGAHGDTLRELADVLQGRIVIDITVPLQPPKVHEVHLPPGQAAALEAQAILGAGTPLVAALHHISSSHLGDAEHAFDSDVLVCSDDESARGVAIKLIGELGMRALDAGPLRNAIALESMTPVLLYMGKRYKHPGAGLRITGI